MTDTKPGWLTAGYPELREGPPWVMEEMILAQPRLVEPILRANGPELTALRASIREAAVVRSPIVVTGCGTSEHAALAVGELLSAALRRNGDRSRVEVRQALDAALDPRPGGVCLAISHDGGTRATRLALGAARSAGATTAIVTACLEGDCVAAADRAFITPRHDDSWCHTLAYTSAILAGANIADGARDTTAINVARLAMESTLARRADFEAAAGHLGLSGRVVTAGLGIDEIGARELALKIAEGARVPTTAYHLETILHGHLAGCDPSATSLVLLATDPRESEHRDRRFGLVARAAQAVGIATVAIGPQRLLDTLPRAVHGVALDPVDGPASLLPALLQGTVALQLLTLGLVMRAGVNPDLIRRDEKAYREAARIGDETADW
ncbi:MAG TPA: hypothetical protein VK576_07065 [Thermoleophilia bacterium]|nr:hypothetical protein [Thermoleophilia bacterium]